jgi:hypothetical protein
MIMSPFKLKRINAAALTLFEFLVNASVFLRILPIRGTPLAIVIQETPPTVGGGIGFA